MTLEPCTNTNIFRCRRTDWLMRQFVSEQARRVQAHVPHPIIQGDMASRGVPVSVQDKVLAGHATQEVSHGYL